MLPPSETLITALPLAPLGYPLTHNTHTGFDWATIRHISMTMACSDKALVPMVDVLEWGSVQALSTRSLFAASCPLPNVRTGSRVIGHGLVLPYLQRHLPRR